jgi:hypothetical protein
MKVVYAGVAAGLAALAYQQDLLGSQPGIDPVTVSSIGPDLTAKERFLLVAGGLKEGCVVTAAGDGVKKDLSLTPVCKSQVPSLASVKWWLDRPDGSVAFLNDGGRVLAEFAAGDGVALESFAPREPLMSLLAL